MGIDNKTLAAAKSYVKRSLQGAGALKGQQGIPGQDGKDGTTYSPIVGTVTLLDETQNATVSVTIDEDAKTAKFHFGIPRGNRGEKGEQGEQGLTGSPGTDGSDGISPTIDVISETDSEYILRITDKNGSITTPNLRGDNSTGNYPGTIPSSNALQQNAYMNVSNNDEKTIPIDSKLGKVIVQAYKYIDGEHNIVNILKTFNNEDSDNFNYNSENVAFDNSGMHLRDSYEIKLNGGDNGEWISEPFNLDDFVSLRKTNVGDDTMLKPDDSILVGSGLQMNEYEIGEYSVIGYTTPNGLFNGVAANEWNSGNVLYMNGGNYFVMTFYQPVNIYRSGTGTWNSYCDKFKIEKLSEATKEFIDISSEIEQITSGIGNTSWELTIKELPSGTYKFILPAGGYRIDSEWFLEIPSFSYLLKNNGKLYCINQDYYDKATGNYIPVDYFDYSDVKCDPLFSHPEYLNGEMPANKFSGNLQLIQNKDIPTIINSNFPHQ